MISLVNKIERIIWTQVRGSFPYDWDEDVITRNILKQFRNKFAHIRIDWHANVIRIECEAYKFTGKTETKHGDIGVLLKIHYRDGDCIEGAAFLEAKRKYRKSMSFEALDFSQLKRIFDNTPNSRLLLYDYDAITDFAKNIIHEKAHRYGYAQWVPYTHCVATPASIVLTTKRNNMSLYKFSLPFSYQLCFRYFQGFDLDFGEDAIKIVKGYLAQKGIPNYLLAFSIAYDKIEPSEITFNREQFSEIAE